MIKTLIVAAASVAVFGVGRSQLGGSFERYWAGIFLAVLITIGSWFLYRPLAGAAILAVYALPLTLVALSCATTESFFRYLLLVAGGVLTTMVTGSFVEGIEWFHVVNLPDTHLQGWGLPIRLTLLFAVVLGVAQFFNPLPKEKPDPFPVSDVWVVSLIVGCLVIGASWWLRGQFLPAVIIGTMMAACTLGLFASQTVENVRDLLPKSKVDHASTAVAVSAEPSPEKRAINWWTWLLNTFGVFGTAALGFGVLLFLTLGYIPIGAAFTKADDVSLVLYYCWGWLSAGFVIVSIWRAWPWPVALGGSIGVGAAALAFWTMLGFGQ